MKNIERQKQLDKKKWIESEEYGCDMSACMEYCFHCGKQKGFSPLTMECTATQEEREQKCLCATAYNRMERARR